MNNRESYYDLAIKLGCDTQTVLRAIAIDRRLAKSMPNTVRVPSVPHVKKQAS